MIRAEHKDKSRIVDILSSSFDDNQSVNYIIKNDKKRVARIRKLMEYSFELCYKFGEVFITEDKNGCALIMLPDQKKTNLKTILLDVNFIYSGLGISHLKKAMSRESKIKKLHPSGPMYYLWFIGVNPSGQHKGIGSELMAQIIKKAELKNRPIYLETSTIKNIPWYEKFGFSVYSKLDLGYELFFLKRETG